MKTWNRLLGTFRSRRREAEMAEEMRLHLEQRTEEFTAAGMSSEDARFAALRRFGGVEQAKELARAQRPSAWLEALWRDVRYAGRSLRRSPIFATTAVLTLALGLGANTAIFSLIDTVLLQPAPYPESGRLVRAFRTAGQSNFLPHSLPDYRDARAEARSFEALTAYQFISYGLAEPGAPAEQVPGVVATADLFPTLGVQPAIGRGFTAEEQQPGRDRVVVLSHECWRRRFGGDADIIGRNMRLDGETVMVIGVMPPETAYPLFWGRVDVWRPLRLADDWRQQRAVRWLSMIGRLRPGVSIAPAQAELQTIAARLARQYPDTNSGGGLRLVPLHESTVNDAGRGVGWLTFGLAVFVLLIACANLSSLQLARLTANGRQVAVRVALGASRAALVRQSLVETLLLAVLGGGLGVLMAWWLNRAIGSRIPVGNEHLTVLLSGRVVIFAVAASLGAGAFFGAIPAWIVSRTGAGDVLRLQARGSTGGRSEHRLRNALLVFEIALTLVLLGSAAVFLSGLREFTRRDLGWQSAGVLTGTITLPENRYDTVEKRRVFHERLLQRVQELPGVEQAALASAVPITALTNAPQAIQIEGRETPRRGEEPLAHIVLVGPHFFEAIGAQLVRGRLIPDDIRPDAPPVAVISESMARAIWPGEDPIGKRVSVATDGSWHEIIGIVRDLQFAADVARPATRLHVYRSFVPDPWGYLSVVVRAKVPEAQAEPLRRAVAGIDADVAVDQLHTVEQAVAESQRFLRVANQLLGGFAALGLLISAVGLYGVIAGLVVRRTPEFGIRLALGARPHDVRWCVLWSGLRMSLLGVGIGLVGMVGLLRVLAAIAPSLPAQDPWVIAAVSGLLVATAGVACWLPAHRATKVDPLVALRAE